ARPLPPAYASAIFDPEREGSLSHFYETMSEGQLHLRGTVLPRRHAAAGPASRYVGAEPGYGRFAREVLEGVDRDLDFGLFDNDGPDGRPDSGDDDGIVDYLFLTAVSTPSGFISRGATGIAGLGLEDEFVSNDRGAGGRPVRILGSYDHGCLVLEGSFAQTVGAMAHEFGHALGLPDLYDLSYSGPQDDSAGIGRWGLMGWGANGWDGRGGPVAFCAYSLEQLGWLGAGNSRLVEVTGELHDVPLRDPLLGGTVYRLGLLTTGVAGRYAAAERQGYLLLERRERGAHCYNRDIPAEGLLVWRVEPAYGANDAEERKLVDLVCADGAYRDAGYPAGRTAEPSGHGDNLDFWAHDATYARVHAGNMGDDTDPFDGERFTRLGEDTNPGVLGRGARGQLPVRLPQVLVRRQGSDLLLDAVPLTWAGRLQGAAVWDGGVLLDGDLEIARGANLRVQPGCRVGVAPRDRLRSGVDPSLVEVLIRGRHALPAWSGQPTYRGLGGASWYGLVLDPGSGEIVGDFSPEQVRDAVHGMSVLGAPEGASGLGLVALHISDSPLGYRAGNGDGQLQPGETFQLVVELANWSFATLQRLSLEVRWPTDWLQPLAGRATHFRSSEFALGPGRTRSVTVTPLTVLPNVPPGYGLAFALSVSSRLSEMPPWQQTVERSVWPGLDASGVEVRLSGLRADGPTLVTVAEPIAVEVRPLSGRLEGVDMVLRDVTESTSCSEMPLHPLGDRTFAGEVRLPQTGTYELMLRAYQSGGASGFLPQRWELRAPLVQWDPVLVVEDPASGEGGSTARRAIEEGLREEQLAWGSIWPQDAAGIEDEVLGHYLGPGKAVIWAGGGLYRGMPEALARYLSAGGALLVASSSFYMRQSPELMELLPFAGVGPLQGGQLRGVGTLADLRCSGTYRELLDPDPAAETLLVDSQRGVAGLRYAGAEYRLVYLPFALGRTGTSGSRLVAEAMRFLHASRRGSGPVISGVLRLGPVEVRRSLRPGLTVTNTGGGLASGFEVVVQVTRGTETVREERLPVQALSAGQEAQVRLPSWRPPAEGRYQVSYSLQSGTQVVDAETQSFDVVDLVGGFARVPLARGEAGNGAALFDADRDGDLDVLVVRQGGESLLQRQDRGGWTALGPKRDWRGWKPAVGWRWGTGTGTAIWTST
ncbi:MAG: immune inhibitor A domain-containing protein, partial [Candidatus Latescibacterota bacterium]